MSVQDRSPNLRRGDAGAFFLLPRTMRGSGALQGATSTIQRRVIPGFARRRETRRPGGCAYRRQACAVCARIKSATRARLAALRLRRFRTPGPCFLHTGGSLFASLSAKLSPRSPCPVQPLKAAGHSTGGR